MKIYVSHSKFIEYEEDLYTPLVESEFGFKHTWILPHEKSGEPYHTKELLEAKEVDVILAEVSFPSTGQGVELGWADVYGIPIICLYRFGTTPSKSLQTLTGEMIEYQDESEMLEKVESALALYE